MYHARTVRCAKEGLGEHFRQLPSHWHWYVQKSTNDDGAELTIMAANIKEPVIINGREYQPIANASRGPLATQKGRLAQPKLGAYTGKQDLEKQDFVNAKY